MLTFKGIYFRFILIGDGGSKQLQCPFGVQGGFTREARMAEFAPNVFRTAFRTAFREVSSYSVPSGLRADLHARPEGPSLMGRVGRTGGTGGTGYQKCPLIFFILCGYIDYVYVYLYTK